MNLTPRHSVLILLLTLLPVAALANEEPSGAGLYLHMLTTDTMGILPEASAVQVTLQTDQPQKYQELAKLTDLQLINIQDSKVTLKVPYDSTFNGPADSPYRAASWVVDFDQPNVAALADQLWQTQARQPSLQQILDFTDASIPEKNYRNGFAIASQVADLQEGDCTEHAVLAAALARAADYHARVVLGMLLHKQDDHYQSYGHAWSEVHTADGWQILDATKPAEHAGPGNVFYVPFAILENEGPGHAWQMLEFAEMRPRHVEVLELP